jgi:hypothetical protein
VGALFWPNRTTIFDSYLLHEGVTENTSSKTAFFTAGLIDGKLKLWQLSQTCRQPLEDFGYPFTMRVQLHAIYSFASLYKHVAAISALDIYPGRYESGNEQDEAVVICGDTKGSVHILPLLSHSVFTGRVHLCSFSCLLM